MPSPWLMQKTLQHGDVNAEQNEWFSKDEIL